MIETGIFSMKAFLIVMLSLVGMALLAACAPTRPHPEYHLGRYDVYKDTHTNETHIERRPVGEEFIVE